MSGNSTPSGKTRRFQRVLARLSCGGRASSPLPSPSSRSNQTVTSSTAQITNSPSTQGVSSSTAPAGPVPHNLLTAGAAPLSSPQATSNPNFLHEVFERLSENDRATLQENISGNASDIGLALEKSLAAAKEKQRCCIEKRWTFTLAGRTVVVKEEADKVIGWLNRFKAVGDVVANVDPVHVGLPWAGVRLLLEAAVSDENQMTLLLVGCGIALYMANRLKAYIEFLHQLPTTLTRTNFTTAVTELYTHILGFLARAIRIYQTSTPRRAFRAFGTDSDIVDFEKTCNELGARVEIEASNCDRTLVAQDRERIGKLKQDLQTVLKELQQSHRLQESLDRLETKIDLDKLLYAKGALYNSYGHDHITCHPDTRVNLLHEIYDWAQHPASKSIFWLSGWAGIGKSTISQTVAEWVAGQGGFGGLDLGASFFFKRGEGDRGSASRFFPTITRELVLKIPGLDALVAKAITQDPSICDKALGEQFDKLIYQPLCQVRITANGPSTFIVVVDALDECERGDDAKTIIKLWSELADLTTVRLKLFVTSRPELHIQLGFKAIRTAGYEERVLQDAVPQKMIQDDILVYLKDEFVKIRNDFNERPLSGTPLDGNWPGDTKLQGLVDRAVPLFIVAATICRFVDDSECHPREQLERILKFPGIGKLGQMTQTYFPVLHQLSGRYKSSYDKDRLHQEFRLIVGSVVSLAEPLTIPSLAVLLEISSETIELRVQSLHSVLRVPTDSDTPIRTLHLSFREFLLSDQPELESFGVNGQATHRMLFSKCLQLLSGPGGLQENLCKLEYPGKPRREIDQTTINHRLSSAFQYACRYWIQHVQHGKVEIRDQDDVHVFLQKHFLHWLEAMSLMNRLAEVIEQLRVLQSLVSSENSSHLLDFIQDAQRVVLANRHVVDLAPLQIYSSAMIFAPRTSVVRNVCSQVPSWIRTCPITPPTWSLELQKLEGHTGAVTTVAFSQDGSLLASASDDETVRLWNPTTGQEVQKLEGHTRRVTAVVFSPDGSLLASASHDQTVRLWNPTTGQEVQKLEGHTRGVTAVAFSQNGLLLASASHNQTVRLWNPTTGQEVQKLEGHTRGVTAVAFSQNGLLLASASHDQTVRLWNPTTGQEVQKLEGYTRGVTAVVFSQNGLLLALASHDRTVRLWNPTTGQEVQKLEGHTDWVTIVAFSQNGSLLASASDDRTVRLWNPTTGQEVQKLEGHTDWVTAVAFSQDGLLLASASWDQTVRLWNPMTGQEVQKLEGHTQRVTAVAFSQDGLLLASASYDETVRLWNPTTGQEVQKLEGHTRGVTAVAFSQNGSLLASALDDQTIRLWNPIIGQEVQKLEGHTQRVTAVAFSQDGSLLASALWDQTVRLWNPMTGQEVQKLEGHTDWVTAVAFSQDGSLLASASNDRTVRLWNPITGQEVQKFEDLGYIRTLKFTNDDKILHTNAGTIDIEKDPALVPVTEFSPSQTLIIKDSWIRQGSYNLLWLPQEYRSGLSTFHNNTLAIGLDSGQISILEIEYFQNNLILQSDRLVR